MTAAARLHAAQRLARAREQAGDVNVEHLAQVGGRRVDDRPERTGARGVHEQVELGQLVEAALDLGFVGDVEVRGRHLAEPRRCDRTVAVRPALAQAAARGDHTRALVGQRARACGPDSRRAACHQRELAQQTLHARNAITR